ncbi:hypothetical protein [Chitinophaga sp. HK235]|uniref:hypothetical protein n=1 Tax=Chitinophaga sp. HK235 TaxID=2952571 RepID=UPI001BAD6273|nr:hypothetical protein [Chitinophaga sp. HK235]
MKNTPLQRGEESYALQVPEQVRLLCELLDAYLSRVLQVFINDLGHDLYGTNGSNERWMAIDYFTHCGYGLHLYPDNLFYGEWVMWMLLFTLPINFISWGVLYGDPNQHIIMIFVQFVVFLLTGWVLFRLIFKRYTTIK